MPHSFLPGVAVASQFGAGVQSQAVLSVDTDSDVFSLRICGKSFNTLTLCFPCK